MTGVLRVQQSSSSFKSVWRGNHIHQVSLRPVLPLFLNFTAWFPFGVCPSAWAQGDPGLR